MRTQDNRQNPPPAYDIDGFWSVRLAGAQQPQDSGLRGWYSAVTTTLGFVEPELSVTMGDPATARILIVASPGAVGKTTLAREIAKACKFSYINLAETEDLGGNFFKGGLVNAFGYDAPVRAVNGELGLVVDGLDEARLRVQPSGFNHGLLDLAGIVIGQNALPTVLFGRSLPAEDAWSVLVEAGFDCCLMEIEFFDDAASERYLETKLPLLAAETGSRVASAFKRSGSVFSKLASDTRKKLAQAGGQDGNRFTGYAPVLDSICSFVLDEDDLNAQARLASGSTLTPVSRVAPFR